MEKMVQIALLFDFYGQLLTGKQIDIVEMYYSNDMSLSEISEQLGISRQGVYDTLKRAEKTLYEYEEKLGLVNRFLQQKDNIKEIDSMLDEVLLSRNTDVESLKNNIIKIKDYIDKLL
ncbi:MAG: YlxM family DNA-binding protein [Bacillota bacterium]